MSIKLILASTVALALIAGTPAYAAKSQSQQTVDSDGGGAKAKSERKTCRTFDRTESRMKRDKLCLTREQWKKFQDEMR